MGSRCPEGSCRLSAVSLSLAPHRSWGMLSARGQGLPSPVPSVGGAELGANTSWGCTSICQGGARKTTAQRGLGVCTACGGRERRLGMHFSPGSRWSPLDRAGTNPRSAGALQRNVLAPAVQPRRGASGWAVGGVGCQGLRAWAWHGEGLSLTCHRGTGPAQAHRGSRQRWQVQGPRVQILGLPWSRSRSVGGQEPGIAA